MPANRNRPTRKQRSPVDQEPSGNATVVPMHTGHEAAAGVERVGDILRRRRQQRGDDLQQIADYLCIRKSFLVALENSDYDELPPDAYVIGFLRSYAAYLGFDGADAINRYRGEMAGRRRKPMLVLPTPIQEGRSPSPFVLVGTALAAMLIYGLWYGLSSGDRTAVNTAPPLPAAPPPPVAAPIDTNGINVNAPPPAAAVVGVSPPAPATPVASPPVVPAPSSKTKTPAAATPAPAPTPAPDKKQPPAVTAAGDDTADNTQAPADDQPPASPLTIRAEKESWVLLTDDKGKALIDHVMKPGETFPVPEQDGLKLTTGNSGGITLLWDGKVLPKLSRDSSILHDIPVDFAKLKAQAAKSQ